MLLLGLSLSHPIKNVVNIVNFIFMGIQQSNAPITGNGVDRISLIHAWLKECVTHVSTLDNKAYIKQSNTVIIHLQHLLIT